MVTMHLLSGSVEWLPTFMVDLPISLIPTWSHPHRPTQRNVSTVIINLTKWMTRLTTTLHQHYFPSIILMRSYWNSPYSIWLKKMYHFAPKINIIMIQSHGNTENHSLLPTITKWPVCLKKKSLCTLRSWNSKLLMIHGYF